VCDLYYEDDIIDDNNIIANQKFIQHTRIHSFDHSILESDPSAENGMSVAKAINHVSRKPIWEPAFEISSLNRIEGEEQLLNFTCSLYRPFEHPEAAEDFVKMHPTDEMTD
jgi:hypothetical protein